MDLLKRTPLNLGNLTAAETDFSTYDPVDLAPLPLLVQSGYLTIKETVQAGRSRVIRLAYPNAEIEDSFSRWLVHGFCRVPGEDLTAAQSRMIAALNAGQVEDMLQDLRGFFTKGPNSIAIENEKYYPTIFYTVFRLLGAMIEAEVNTNLGRVDAVVKTRTDIFVFEFKLHDTAEAAMKQIRRKRYAEPYLADGRRVTVVGVAFDAATRNLGKWLIEPATVP